MKAREKTSEEILREHGLEPDPVIEAYKKDVDRTLLDSNLRLTVEQRIQKLEAFVRALQSIRGSACKVAE